METILPISTWSCLENKKDNTPLLIAGPCSAESEDQLYKTCKALKELKKVDVIRAGIWKPRTTPGNFEGNGEVALKWFQEIKKELHIPITTEVATPEHLELAFKYDIDIIWIGARTTINPFMVQQLVDAMRGVDIPVMIKNPTSPDLALWEGAFKRFLYKGFRKLAAIHRGFSVYQETDFRNSPIWDIPISLKNRYPNIPLLCDPSHIAGRREFIPFLVQKATDLNYSGYMIETHIDPKNAWSDSSQQITPKKLLEIIENIQSKKSHVKNEMVNDLLRNLRDKIDTFDRKLIDLLIDRMSIVEKLGDYKKEENIMVYQQKRWKEVLDSRLQWGNGKLDKEFLQKIFELIHGESIRIQTGSMEDMKE